MRGRGARSAQRLNTDIVAQITAHLASELRRDIPVATRIKIFWARAEALRHDAPHEQIKQQFMALAMQSGLITDLGHYGDEDVRHVLDWALLGRVPFESSKPISRDKNNDHQSSRLSFSKTSLNEVTAISSLSCRKTRSSATSPRHPKRTGDSRRHPALATAFPTNTRVQLTAEQLQAMTFPPTLIPDRGHYPGRRCDAAVL